LLVNIDNFDPSFVLVNINKLKPYVPYDDNTRKLKFKFQGGKGEGTTLETQESLEEFMEDENKDKTDEGEGSQQEKTHDTLQPNISQRETITELTNQNEKVRDEITTSWAYLTLALI